MDILEMECSDLEEDNISVILNSGTTDYVQDENYTKLLKDSLTQNDETSICFPDHGNSTIKVRKHPNETQQKSIDAIFSWKTVAIDEAVIKREINDLIRGKCDLSSISLRNRSQEKIAFMSFGTFGRHQKLLHNFCTMIFTVSANCDDTARLESILYRKLVTNECNAATDFFEKNFVSKYYYFGNQNELIDNVFNSTVIPFLRNIDKRKLINLNGRLDNTSFMAKLALICPVHTSNVGCSYCLSLNLFLKFANFNPNRVTRPESPYSILQKALKSVPQVDFIGRYHIANYVISIERRYNPVPKSRNRRPNHRMNNSSSRHRYRRSQV